MNKNLKNSNMSKVLYTFIIVNLMFPTEMIYAAGIKLDESVSKQYNSTIGKTKNGIDQIDIVNPNNGVSHNKFLEYNVNQRGVILNNSKDMVRTDLAGLIDGNANLTNNADLIITEITGTNRSDIEGFTEIAGKRADYVLANPNGVYLDGAGFINTDRVTISTGKVINDSNLALQVRDGVIEVGNKGISTENVDYFTLLSRAAKINGVIAGNSKENMAEEIEILTGKNEYEYKTKELTIIDSKNDGKYNMAIDTSKLGGLVAGRIKLVGTEEGLGVNTMNLVAPESVELDSQGTIKAKDILTENLKINSKESELDGTIKADSISLSGKSINTGNILADRIIAKVFESDGEVIVNESFVAEDLKNRSNLNSKNIDLGTLDNLGNLHSETLSLKGDSKNSASIVANEIKGKKFENSGTLQGNESIQLDDLTNKTQGTVLSKNVVTTNIINEGKIQADEKLETGDLINSGEISAKDTTVKGSLTNTDRIDSNLEVQGENNLNTGTVLGDTLKISSNLRNTGTLIGKEGIQLESVINEKDILSNKKIVIESIENKTETSKLAGESIDAKIIKNTGLIQGSLTAEDLENKGNVRGELVTVSNKLLNSGKMISRNLNITSETLLNEGTIGAEITTLNSTNLLNRGNLISDILNMNIGEKIENSGYIKANDFTTNAKLDNSGNIIADKIELTNDLKNIGLIRGNLKIANDLVENKGNLEGDIIRITSKSINNSKNILGDATYLNGRLINTSTGLIGSQNLDINGDINNTGILVSDDIALKSETITNRGDIKATNNIAINSTNLINENNILANKNIDIESLVDNSGKISGNIKIRGGQDSATSIINTGELSGSVDIKSNVLNNAEGTIKGDIVKIDHMADENLNIEGTYLANNLEITAKKSIDNNNNSIKASKGIKLTSHEGEILNDGKIIAGEEIIFIARNIKNGTRKTGLEAEADRESLIESGTNLDIKGNYINSAYGTLIGGLGRTNLTMAKDLVNYGKIISRNNLEVNSANFFNNGQVLAGQDLKIKADKIENNEDKLIYAKANMTLEGKNIQNKMGTILTTDGDITLKATENINNKANALKGGKIKAGNTLNIIAKNYENEGYKYQDGYFTNLYNPDGFASGKSWEQFLDASVSGSQRRILNWKNYGFSSFFKVVDGGTVEGAYNTEWDGDWHYGAPSGDTQYYEVGGTVKIDPIKSPIRVRQSITEAKNINVELTESFKNRGIVTAENNIHVKAKDIINETEVIKTSGVSEYKGKAQAVVIKTNLVTAHKWYSDGPRIYDIKTKKYINIAEEKARITAGGNITLDGNVINTDTTNLENVSGVTSALQDTIKKNQAFGVEDESKDVNKDSEQGEISGITEKIKNDETQKINEVNKEKEKTDEKEKEIEKNSQSKDEMINEENKNTQESLANQEELIRNQMETQKKLNITDYIELPKGNHGLFKKNEEFDKRSNNRPLIETNISFIDKSKYFASDYFFEKVKYTPDNIRTLGDSYYDTTLINDVLKRNFERKKAVNEISTMKNLLDNASKSYEKLGLKVGEELTTEQLNNLDHDIVWYVEVEVDGHKVLAPQLYVAKKGLEKGPDNSSIDGKNITVKNGRLLNTGNIEAQNVVNVDTNEIINKNNVGKAKIKGESIYLQAQNDIKNLGSTIEGTNVLLNSKDGDIVNESLVEKNQLLNSENYTTEIVGVSKIKGETVNIKGNNYFQKGAILSGKDGSLDVKDEIKIEGLKLESKTKESGYKLAEVKNEMLDMIEKQTGEKIPGREKEYSGTKYEKDIVATENVGSIVNFSGNLVAKAGNDINVLGSEITAKEALIQGKNINVEGVKDVNDSSYKTSKKEFAYSKDEDIQKKTEKVLESKIKTQGDLTLVATDGDITFKGSSREAGGTIRSLAEKGSVKDLTLETNNTYKRTAREVGFNDQTLGESKEVTDARKNVLDRDGIKDVKGTNAKLKHSSNAGIETDVDNLHSRGFINGTNHSELYASGSATVGLVISDIDEEVNSTLHKRSSIKAKNEIILAKGDVVRESITGNITEDSTVKSLEGDIKYTTAKDKVSSNVDKTTYSLGQEYSYRVAPLEFVEKTKARIDYSNNSSYSAKNAKANGKETPGEGAEALARIAETAGDISKLASGEVASVSRRGGVNITDTNKKSSSSTALENELNIGGTQTFIGKNVDLEGIKGDIGNLNIKAKKLDIKAAKDTYTENNDGFSLFVGDQASASLNTDSASISGEGAVDFAYIKSDTDSATYKTGNINVKNKVNLDVEDDVTFKGLGIKGKDVTAKIGGDLKIESLQNKVDHKAMNINANASAGVALNTSTGGVPTPTATVGATYGQVTENKAWVKEQAGLTSTNEYNVDVEGKTDLVGARLGSETAGKTNFSTKELTTKNLKDTHDREGFYAGGGASFGKSGVGGIDLKGGNAEGYERAQDTKTTIGTGNIKVNGEEAKLDDVNRDFSKSQVKTKDKVIFKTDFDFSFGMPKKNKKKKNKTSKVDSDTGSSTSNKRNSIVSDNDSEPTYNRKLRDNDSSNPNKGRPLPDLPTENSNKRILTDNNNIYDEIADTNINQKKNPNKGRPLPEIPTESSNNRKLTDADNDGVYNRLNESEKKSSENIYDKVSDKKTPKIKTDGEDHTYFVLEKEEDTLTKKTVTSEGEEPVYFVLEKEDEVSNKKTVEEDTYETLDRDKMDSENIYDKLETAESSSKKVAEEEHPYFVLEKEEDTPTKKTVTPEGEEPVYFVLEKEDEGSNKKIEKEDTYETLDRDKIDSENIYDKLEKVESSSKKIEKEEPLYFVLEKEEKTSTKKASQDEIYDTIDESKMNSDNIYDEIADINVNSKKNPNKGRPLPELPSKKEAGADIKETLKNKGFSDDEGNKVHKEAVAKLKTIANSADNLPTEHLMKALNDITGLDVNEYDKLTRDPKTGKINPKAREYFQKTLTAKGLGNSEVKKSLDKIFKALNKPSEEYKEVKQKLDTSLMEKLGKNPEFKELMKEKLTGNKENLQKLFNLVEEAKHESFKEVTGIDSQRAKLTIDKGGKVTLTQGGYANNKVKINESPLGSFLRSRKANNEEILNTFIHELTHHDQEQMMKNKNKSELKDIKKEAEIFKKNNDLYIHSGITDMKKYKRQPLEKEAFETGDSLAKDLMKKVNGEEGTKKFKGPGKNNKTGEKTPDSAVKKLKTIADNVDSIPKEHLLLTLEQMGFGLSVEDGQKLLSEAKKHPERKVIYPEKVNIENKEVKKSLDKIFVSLGKRTSEDYKAVKKKLDDSLTAKLESNPEFKKLMKEKLTGDKEKIQKLFYMVEQAKYDSFEEVTGLDTPRADLTINDGGKLSLTQGGYASNNVETNASPLGSFFRSRKANNEEILNTLIHELTHQDQDKLAKNKDDSKIKEINDEARVFNINDKLYIDADLKDSGKYKRQPLEKEAFETGDKLGKDLIKKVSQRDNPENDVKELDLTKYNKAKDGIVGEEGHTYKLNPKKEGKILENIEKSYKESKAKYLNEPTDANLKEFKKKEKAFEDNLKKYNKKIDLILKQEDIKQENVLDKVTDSNDKYGGKVVTIKKEDIGVVKPVKKVEKQKLTAEQKKEYSKGKLGQYFKGKPDILDPKMRPENIGEVKDNTVNILIHGTFSAKSAENDWASSKSVHAKSINEQYGGEAVSFKWSGKNTADTRKEAGKELAKIIEGYNKKGIKVNVIAHSHGGNVANEALKLTNGKIDNLVTLGTPVRSDHKADAKIIESKTDSYLNVMSNEDTVTRQGGFDTKTDVTKYIGGNNAFRRANRKDKNADKVLKIDGASHSELHSLAVIKQLKPLAKRAEGNDISKEGNPSPTKKFKGPGKNNKTGEKTPDSAVKKLKTIADNVDSIPKEHLLLTLEQMGFGLSMEDGQKLLAEAKKHPERKVIYPEKVNIENKEVKKSLDKIFVSLGKRTSEDYKAVKKKLDDSLTAKLENNPEFKKLMKEKLTGDKEKIQKLFYMVEQAKYDSFEEVTGLDTPRADLTINDGGKLSLTQGGYANNNVETNASPLGSFFRSRKANNEEILNTLIHELTHQDQDKLAKNKDDSKIKGINDEARVFNINDKLYIDADLKDSGKYKRQPLEKEAFETGDKLAKDLMESINK